MAFENRLNAMQRKMARCVLGVEPTALIGPGTLRELSWLTILDTGQGNILFPAVYSTRLDKKATLLILDFDNITIY